MKIHETITIFESIRTSSFLDEFYETTDEHPFKRNARIYNGVIIELTPFANTIHIADIVSTQPRNGQGVKAIEFLKYLADKHRVTLDLLAKAYTKSGSHMNTRQLVHWYIRMGFNITDELVDDPNDLEGLNAIEMKYFPR